MSRTTMKIDVDKCTGCYACFLSCRDEFMGNDYLPHSAAQPEQGQNWIRVEEIERGSFPKVKVAYTPIMCQQCEDAPCIEAASDGAVYRRDDGIVIIDPEKAKGQQAIAESCPYGVISWNAEQNLAQKCTFCSHLLDQGKNPRCVEACPVDVIQIGNAEQSGNGEMLNPEFGLNPTVSYTGLPKKFIAGEVVINENGAEECISGVSVHLKNGSQEWSTSTDAFGDFEFEGLGDDENLTLVIAQEGFAPVELPVSTASNVNLGVIELVRR